MSRPRAWVWWSSGKDSAWALHTLRTRGDLSLRALVTTLDSETGRVGLHGTPRRLLAAQAASLGLELRTIELPWPAPNEAYERAVSEELVVAAELGVAAMAFGDLFLGEIREYRQQLFAGSGIEPLFPLWGRDTDELARAMVAGGIDAIVTGIDTRVLGPEALGRRWDAAFLAALPAGVDPCGEKGEFHTFVCNGPGFAQPIEVTPGRRVEHGDFMVLELD